MACARYANTKKSLLLVTLMILMTQVGYLENLNPWISGEEALDSNNEVAQSSAVQNLTASVEGADLSIDVPMTNITFQYNASAASGSGSGGSGSGSGSSSSNNATVSLLISGNQYGLSESIGNGNTLFFYGYDATNGYELWKSDGTTSGTVMVKDIHPSGSSNPENFAVLGNTVYFSANDGTNGTELWKTDGTASGTVMVKDIYSGSSSSDPRELTVFGNSLYFQANNGFNGIELWKSDGTASGTTMVKDINSGSVKSAPPNGGSYGLTEMGNELYFRADDGTNGVELWKTDGTASGTSMVKDIYPGNSGNPQCITTLGSTIFFKAYNSTHGSELWKSDGTSSGTVMVKDIRSGSSSGLSSSNGGCRLTTLGNTLIFEANDGTHGRELWKSDGTTTGTVLVYDIFNGSFGDGMPVSGADFFNINNTLMFTAKNSASNTEWWKSDGTASGTGIVKEIRSGSDGSYPSFPVAVGNTLYFEANDGTHGSELWKSDGTDAGTVMVHDLRSGGGSDPVYLIHAGTNLFFSAYSGTSHGIYVLNNTFQYNTSAGSGLGGMTNVTGATCTVSPALPTGLSIDSSTCTISGTPTVAAVNTTYMVTAVIGGTTYAAEIWLDVLGLIGPVVGVNNTLLPDVQPMYAGANLIYEVEPSLPASLSLDAATGVISGTPTETIGNTTFTLYANDTNGDSLQWNISIEILEDTDGDGLPNLLPPDYDGENDDHRPTPGLTEDLDDDNDGLNDTNETDTGLYVDESDTGTDPLDPDTDDDGFCDGPIAIPGVCFAGPDPFPHDSNLPIDTDGDGLPDNDDDWDGPPYADDDDDGDGYPDTSEVACGSDPLDPNSLPQDMDGDGICDGEDLDMDGDGIDNVNESGLPLETLPNNPDTDGDGVCDGPISPVTSNCTAGPDVFPLDPSAWNDTDGDGDPDELFPPSNSTPPLVEDLDDDNDGWSDIDEVNCGSDPLNASDMPVDLNGDGICDVLDLDWDDDGIPNANETDTGVYNDSSDTGTDPWNPDTDGDGFCDGPFAVFNETDTICIAGPDPFPHDPTLPLDTDGDGSPDELPEDYIGNLVEDTDDDGDGYSDVSELNCDSDPLDATSTPTNDLDGDGLCDAEDPDVDGDGLSNETELADGSLTSYMNADTDGDGICDGPIVPAMPLDICVAGPDAFPDDAAAWLDTDGDGDPDEIVDGMTTDLILDLDDDDDGWLDADEIACGSDSKDNMSSPVDGDNDGICDIMDTQTLAYSINDVEAEMFEAYVNQSDFVLLPNLTGMEAGTWTITPELPAGLTFSGTMARSGETGIISGIPTEASPMTNYTVTADNGLVNISFTFGLGVLEDTDGDRLPDEPSLTGLDEDLDDDNDGHIDEIEIKCGSDPLNQSSVPDVDEDGNCIEGKYADDDSDDDSGFLLCLLPFCLILLLALLLFALLFRDKVVLMGPEPENTTSDPSFLSGAGTKDDPFVLKPVKALKAGTTVEAKETISIVNMSPEIMVTLLDLAEAANDKRFRMYEVDGTTEEPGFNLEADDEGRLRLRFVFDDSDDPTYRGGTYNGLLKLGKASVYLSWTVNVKEDKNKMKQLRKEQEAAEKAEKEAKEAEEKAKAETEAKEAEEKAKAEADAKAAEEKAAKEAEEKAKAEEKAAAAALAKKAKEEEEAKKKAEAEAKAAKEAEEKAKAEAAAKKEAEKKPATTKEAKKQEELQRVKQRAKTIDFKVLGEASSSELKSEVKKGATTLEVANAKDFAESGSAEINDAKGSTIIAWTGKDGNTLTGVSGVTRVFAAKAVLMAKDDLQVIKGIGPFIEEKLNALGITTYRQMANMTAKLETQVNEAIEFFPGRVKRDQWVNQSKILLGMDVKIDEKALKQAEELERIAQKAEGIDFGVLGVASASEADDLQKIKGIGPFIAEKLNALGIYKFSQLANMTSEIEEEVNVSIEFFPGRVKRDEWAKQAKEFAKD